MGSPGPRRDRSATLCGPPTDPSGARSSGRARTAGSAMKERIRIGQPITPEQFEQLSDEQLARLVPRAYREFFPCLLYTSDAADE